MAWPRRENYLGNKIPTSAGIIFIVVPLLVFSLRFAGAVTAIGLAEVTAGLAGTLEIAPYNERVVISLGFLVIVLCLLGFFDDVYGGGQAKGFKGHFIALFKGRITTGLIKAAGGGIAALAAAWYIAMTPIGWEVVLNGVLIALAVNTFNLFDLRPGRATKAFFAALALLWVCTIGAWFWTSPALWIFIALAVVLFPFDLKAKIMIGDAGSNVLGGIVGLAAVVTLGPAPRIAAFIAFLSLNIISEKWSFTKIIEAIPPLRWLDEVGRGS